MIGFGKAVSLLRKQQGLSQGQLAELLGVSRQTVNYWERERYTPEPEHVNALASILEVNAEWLGEFL